MWRTLELSKSPTLAGDTSSQKFKSDSTLVGKEVSEVKVTEKKLISGPSSNSKYSFQSTLTASTSIIKGQLKHLRKGNVFYFKFSVDNDPQLIYIASQHKIDSSAEKNIDSMYFFYFKNSKKSESRKLGMNLTNLIAKMKVSTSIILNPNNVKIMETEFVLYGSQAQLSNGKQKSWSSVSSSKTVSRKFSEMFRQTNAGKIKQKDKVNGHRFCGLGDINDSSVANEAFDGLLPNFELAGIVVNDCFQNTTKDLMFGGWGLKFLERASQNGASSELSYFSEKLSDTDELDKEMNIILPAGLHGGLVAGHGGPAGIIARWRSGGHCDCGGWDIGCPLTVLNYSSKHLNASTKDTGKKSINIQGASANKSGDPIFSMMKMKEGLYSICFRSFLSVLQSFSIAVAAIHTKKLS